MKRIAIVLSLLAGLVGTMSGFSMSTTPAIAAYEVTDLPWSTVSTVLEAVTDVRPYTYAELVEGYQAGLVTVKSLGSGYEVRITDADGLVDVLIINDL